MDSKLGHGLDLVKTQDQIYKEKFVSSLRAYVLNDLASDMRQDFEKNVAGENDFSDGFEVHKAMKGREIFSRYSSIRCAAQEMVWGSVIDEVNDNIEYLETQVKSYSNQAEGSLVLDPDFEFPKYYTSLDVHLMPGNYEGRVKGANSLAGAVYDNGFNVFAFGAMGKQFNDIGMSMANCVRLKFPDLLPEVIVDVGCTIGHNTLPWKETFPSAEVYGLDLAGPCLQYAHARAEAMNIKAHFRQASAQELPFDDESVDIVFSSMFLHEMPVKEIRKFMDEAFRVLKKGGVMFHMELPPNDSLTPYDAFYLDWDSYYNNEPFYKTFRDLGYRDLCSTAGFQEKSFFESVMPRFTYVSEDVFEAAVSADASFDENTGRLSDSIQWYGFGSRKD